MPTRVIIPVLWLAWLGAAAPAAGQPTELHWRFDESAFDAGVFRPVTGDMEARLNASSARFAPDEAGAGLTRDGSRTAMIVRSDIGGDVDLLPEDAMTVSAWVSLSSTTRWGGVVGVIEDNGGAEKGWILGYNDSVFTFGLASTGADDGDGVMTYLEGDAPIVPGRWHHVVGVFDGREMRLYVDGKLDAGTEAQTGAILYDRGAPLAIGGYLDSNEDHPLHGRIREVRIEPRALTTTEITRRFRADQALTRLEPWFDTSLNWVVEPYLCHPRLDGMAVLFETSAPGTARVEYRSEDGRHAGEDEGLVPGTMHEVILDGLNPNTKYFYRAIVTNTDGSELASALLTFRTASTPDMPYTFVAIGDTQSQPQVVKRVSDLAYEHRPNFMVHAGDLVSTGSNKRHWTGHFFPNMQPLIGRVPIMPVLGNHEQDAPNYYNYFALPGPEYYYSFAYGNAEFFMIDANKDLRPGTEQHEWLDKALGECEATWKFVVHHQPAYTSDSNDYGDTYKGPSTRGDARARQLIPLYDKHGVDIVFCGHVHDYERTFPIKHERPATHADGGVIYVTTAGGGGHLEDFDPANTWFGHKKARRHHFCYVAVNGPELEFQAIDEEGRLFDVMTLKKDVRR